MQNIHTIEVDIKHKNSIFEPTVTSNDDVVFIVKVTDDANLVPTDLVTTALLANTRGDRQTVLTPGTIEADGTIRFELGTSETAIPGQVKAVAQLYNAASERISTIDFSYKVLRDPTGEGYIPSENERTLIEVVLEDGPGIMAAAQQITEQAVAVTQATEAERVATQEERLLTRGIRENMELVRQATITVKNDTEAVQLATEEVRKNTEAERLATEAVKKATDSVRIDTEEARDAANMAASETQQVKMETAAVRDATQKVQDATVLVKNETQAVKEATEAVRAQTAQVRDETNLAKAATIKATSEAVQATEQSVAVTQSASQALVTFGTDAGNALQAFDQQSASDLQEFDAASQNALETFDSQSASIVYEAQEATVKAKEAAASTQGAIDFATQQGDFALQVAEANRTKWLPPVVTFAELATKYSKPNEGDTVRVTAEARIYKFSGGAWIVTDEYNPAAIDELASKVNETARQTQLLQNGVNVLNADVATPVDFEIQGRTLTSLANSNLEALKYYALADKKTKIIVDNATIAGIGKFQKKSTTLTTADYVGKVPGSTVANPHIFYHLHAGTTLLSPKEAPEHSQGYGGIAALGGGTAVSGNGVKPGGFAQHYFAFNMVEQLERQLGLIPKVTLAEKIQWIKDNANRITSYWNGYGTGPTGNKATFKIWFNGAWVNSGTFEHTSGIVARLSGTTLNVAGAIQNDGFVHFVAYSDPQSETVSSYIYTDFINLEIELKATAQLNTRGKIIRVENFEGKVAGSNVENPHEAKQATGQTSLQIPSSSNLISQSQGGFDQLKALDGNLQVRAGTAAGTIAQQLFSFNLIEAIERNIGKIPASDTAGKVAWIKANVGRITGNWWGYGYGIHSKDGVAKSWAKLAYWNGVSWSLTYEQTLGTVSKAFSNAVVSSIDSNGFAHFLAYAEPSDGITASTINTDYVELEIELKPDANFANPKVALYEVTKEEFDKISITWSDEETLKRFPIVEVTQHLLNPYVMAEGENLFDLEAIPMVSNTERTATGFIVKNGYSNALGAHSLKLLPNKEYTLSAIISASQTNANSFGRLSLYNPDNGAFFHLIMGGVIGQVSRTFTTPSDIEKYKNAYVYGLSLGETPLELKEIMLNLGGQQKPFTPRNPSYLYAETKLGAIGNAKDVLFRQDGQWKRRKVVEKDVVLDGSIAWSTANIHSGFKQFYTASGVFSQTSVRPSIITANDGSLAYSHGQFTMMHNDGRLYVSVPDAVTGLLDSGTLTAGNTKRYFNGWKYTDGTTWHSVTGNGQTATAQQALDTKPTDYTPYKLSYVLANPVIENVNVDGDIVADGLTQLEIGAGFSFTEVNGKRTYTRTPVSQRPKLTTNPVDLKAIFAKNIRSAVDDLAGRASDNTTRLSIHERSILELYIKVKALEV